MRWRETSQSLREAWREITSELNLIRRNEWQFESVNLRRSSNRKLGQEEPMAQRRLGCHSIVASGLFSSFIRGILHLSVRRKLHHLARYKRTLSAKMPSLLVSAQIAPTPTNGGSSRSPVWRT